jgi:hypothetical protein
MKQRNGSIPAKSSLNGSNVSGTWGVGWGWRHILSLFPKSFPMACLPWELQRGKAENWAPCTFLRWKTWSRDMSHDCVKYMSILLCGWPNFRLTRDVTRALPTLIAGLFTPSSLEQKKWHHVPGTPFAYYYRGSKFTAITLVLVFLYCCLYIDVNRFTYLSICVWNSDYMLMWLITGFVASILHETIWEYMVSDNWWLALSPSWLTKTGLA